MNAILVILLSVISSILLSLSIYYGYQRFIRNRDDNNFNLSSRIRIKNHYSMFLDLEEGTQRKGDLTVTVTKEYLESLPGYNKFTFTTSGKSDYSTVYFNSNSIDLKDDYFKGATIYSWFSAPLLAIINTVKMDDKDSHKTIYFRATDNRYRVFKPYTPDKDLLHDNDEIHKLLVELNKELHNLISVDIGSIDCDTIDFNDHTSINTVKETSYTSPFVKMTVKMTGPYCTRYFQVHELKYNSEKVKIEFPTLKLYSFAVYLWKNIPLLLELETKNMVIYYFTDDQKEWKRALNDNGKEIRNRLSESAREHYLEDINFKMNKAIFLDLGQIDDYHYLGQKISVVKHDLGSTLSTRFSAYTHHLNDSVFKLGACMIHCLFISDLPIGIDISSLTVFKNRGMNYLVQIIHSENGTTKDKYYRVERDSKWYLVKDPTELVKDIESHLKHIYSYLGPVVDLDLGKKVNYGLTKEPDTNKSYHVAVNFYDVLKPYTIYTHKPSANTNITNTNEIFSFNNVLYNGAVLRGFFPGSISKARVYLLDDTIPVGVKIFTNNGTVNYINNGHNVWSKFNDSGSRYLLDPHEFMRHSRDSNIIVAIDLGLLTYNTNVNQKPSFEKEMYGKYVRYIFKYQNHPHFKFKGLFFKGNKYNFDSDSLFLKSFIKIIIYFDANSRIPLAFELQEAKKSLFYANNFDGKWLRILSLEEARIPPMLDAIAVPTHNTFVIDNYASYVSGVTPVTVDVEAISDKYVKYTHNFSDSVNSKGIIYNGYLIRGLPNLEQTHSISVYFKKSTHSLLIVQNNGQYSAQIYTNGGNDNWNLVSDSYDIVELLNQTDANLHA